MTSDDTPLEIWQGDPKAALKLPPLIVPTAAGYMPLTAAAQWIATEGGTHDFAADDLKSWRPAFAKLLAAIASEDVKLTWVRKKKRKRVPGHLPADCPILYPYQDPDPALVFGEELCLQTFTYENEEEWRDDFSDRLLNHDGVRWSRLMVLRSDIMRLWPFTFGEPHKTGLAGRPSFSNYLIDAELERRATAGLTAGRVSLEAQELVDWFKLKHDDKPQPKPKNTENHIRERYWQIRGRTK